MIKLENYNFNHIEYNGYLIESIILLSIWNKLRKK